MKIVAEGRLFWFLKEGTELDLTDPSALDLYVQQVVSRGGEKDIRALLKAVPFREMATSLGRLGRFLPSEVKMFWEDFIGSHQ